MRPGEVGEMSPETRFYLTWTNTNNTTTNIDSQTPHYREDIHRILTEDYGYLCDRVEDVTVS